MHDFKQCFLPAENIVMNSQTIAKRRPHAGNTAPTICKFFTKGSCWKGSQCTYRHVQRDQPQASVDVTVDTHSDICPYYRRGYCRFKDACKWSHVLPVLTDEATNIKTELQPNDCPPSATSSQVLTTPVINNFVFPLDAVENGSVTEMKGKFQTFITNRSAIYFSLSINTGHCMQLNLIILTSS